MPGLSVRLVAVAVALVLPPMVLPARATPHPPDRVVVGTYSQPRGTTTGGSVGHLREPAAFAVARADEDRVRVSATTRMGSVVALAIDITRPGAGTHRTLSCNPVSAPVTYRTEIAVTPVAGRCPDGRISTPLNGVVTVAFHRRPPPKPKTASPDERWAVLIGIRDYAGRTHSTIGGVGDVNSVRAALLASGWRSDHILVVTEQRASAGGIRAAMDWLAKVSTPRTFSLLHYSGHICIASRGPCRSGHTYLWAHDNRFIPETEVISRMKRVQGYSWLDIAGCQSGAFAFWSSRRMFTASSRADETSYEFTEWKRSIWTGLVWDKAFREGRADPKRRHHRATIGQMTAYGKKYAPTMTQRHPAGAQHPVVKGGSGSWTLYAPPGG